MFLLAVGAIVAFALQVHAGFLGLSVADWILMIAGAIGLMMTATIDRSRRRTVLTSQPPPAPGERRLVDEPDVSSTTIAHCHQTPTTAPRRQRSASICSSGKRLMPASSNRTELELFCRRAVASP
jgi:hypothetical protein